MANRYFLGLDLGQGADPTALAILERPLVKPGSPPGLRRPTYALRHLRRFSPGTHYSAIIETLRDMLSTAPLSGSTTVVLDQTGVGQAVVGLIVDGLRDRVTCMFVPVTITAGGEGLAGENALFVPRKELVGVLQVLLQTRRLHIPVSLPYAELLVDELVNFKARIVLTRDTIESWRDGPHDDLVLAVGLAAWQGEATLPPLKDPPRPWPTRVRA